MTRTAGAAERGPAAGLLAVARRRPEITAAILVTLLSTAAGVAWLLRVRRGGLLDVDEAGYLGGTFDDTTGLERDGLLGLWRAWTAHADFAPLVPASAVPFQLLLGRHLLAAFLALDLWLGVLLVSVASVARRLAGAGWAIVAVVAVAGLPGVVDESRSFHFGLAATALLMATVAALLASDRLRSRRWALAAGLCAGATLLARSMMVALVPAALVAALLLVAASPERRRSAANLALGCIAALALAATWYGPNLGTIWAYLTQYGYGGASADYGTPLAPWDPSWWGRRAGHAIRDQLGLPITLLLVAGGVALLVAVAGRLWSGRLRVGDPVVLAASVCAVTLAGGYLALSTSPNQGTAFELPLLPPAVCLAVAGMARIRRPEVRRSAVVALAAAAALVLVVKSVALPGLASRHAVTLPLAGDVAVIDGSAEIQRYASAGGGAGLPGGSVPGLIQGWNAAAATLEARLVAFASDRGRLPVVCFATRDPFVSTNHIGMVARYWYDGPSPRLAQLTPRRGGDSVANYRDMLSRPEEGQPNLLVTGDPSDRDFRPPVTQSFAVEAARDLGFTPAFADVLPDGRRLQVWWLQRGPVVSPG